MWRPNLDIEASMVEQEGSFTSRPFVNPVLFTHFTLFCRSVSTASYSDPILDRTTEDGDLASWRTNREQLRTSTIRFSFVYNDWPTDIIRELDSDTRQRADAEAACRSISSVISSQSAVFAPGSLPYTQDTRHYATSSSQSSACSVEPGNVDDLSKILHIVARQRVPFAVKGGGHTMNQGFSSTPGIHIAMSRFSEINYDASSQTVDVGAGLVFDDVYKALEPHGVNVVGGRVTGIGVAGFTLGGGFAWLSNERGLALDNVLAFGLVLPNGTYTNVTQSSNPDLFFGLKGGFNNFGVVTRFTLKTHPQGLVWGGFSFISEEYLDEVNAATAKFTSSVHDPKAGLIVSYAFTSGTPLATFILFYNGPTPPSGIFDDILAIPAFEQNISTQSFPNLIQSIPAQEFTDARGIFDTVSLTSHSENYLRAVVNETVFWGETLIGEPGFSSSYALEPFLPSAFAQAPTESTVRESVEQLRLVAEAEGQRIADLPLYGNYAIFGTSLERIYGGNVERLRRIKRQYDPDNIMGLAVLCLDLDFHTSGILLFEVAQLEYSGSTRASLDWSVSDVSINSEWAVEYAYPGNTSVDTTSDDGQSLRGATTVTRSGGVEHLKRRRTPLAIVVTVEYLFWVNTTTGAEEIPHAMDTDHGHVTSGNPLPIPLRRSLVKILQWSPQVRFSSSGHDQ
ncbi:hypothetical protein NLI96_g5753 [Meripilus lineatus]|uniref:FAD-binding PCMH-type domain-containing protein n=1 Tax=Meripilus lineatus TaxID=2056292 RepID=A0AAD5YEJ8_9APHY|nr:hypothetical protein NLI96_g5753 [Physisporinus lineatus]